MREWRGGNEWSGRRCVSGEVGVNGVEATRNPIQPFPCSTGRMDIGSRFECSPCLFLCVSFYKVLKGMHFVTPHPFSHPQLLEINLD